MGQGRFAHGMDRQMASATWKGGVAPARLTMVDAMGKTVAPDLDLSKCLTGEGNGPMATKSIFVNRASVLTLWAAVVVQAFGFDEDATLTLGKAVAGLNAQAKGRRLGIF